MILNFKLRGDIVAHFENLVSAMPVKDRNLKRASLGNLTPLQMLKYMQSNNEIGNKFINKMINEAFKSCDKDICDLGTSLIQDKKVTDKKLLN